MIFPIHDFSPEMQVYRKFYIIFLYISIILLIATIRSNYAAYAMHIIYCCSKAAIYYRLIFGIITLLNPVWHKSLFTSLAYFFDVAITTGFVRSNISSLKDLTKILKYLGGLALTSFTKM